ncbi:hypothetical protein [Methylibium sp.]|uniref:hypothetical protein n=1 Tax=Methylibium sp. TaxID=2067992 RepID=UPI0017CB1782|nr:hypothetical protein [Methylibium sp.]MBA3590368.1 hypothetical protein [Methylibium sp.]
MTYHRDRDELTLRYARTLREAERNQYDWIYCAHKAKPFNPWPWLCAAAVIALLWVAA